LSNPGAGLAHGDDRRALHGRFAAAVDLRLAAAVCGQLISTGHWDRGAEPVLGQTPTN
jgi:hypothetical protein